MVISSKKIERARLMAIECKAESPSPLSTNPGNVTESGVLRRFDYGISPPEFRTFLG